MYTFLNVITVTGERHKQPISTTPCALVAEHINTDFSECTTNYFGICTNLIQQTR